MNEIAVFFDETNLGHNSGPDHPERPSRVTGSILALRKHQNLLEKMNTSNWDTARENRFNGLLHRVHSRSLLNQLKSTSEKSRTMIDSDTIANAHTYAAAISAAKVAVLASETARWDHSIFCLTRPPGHHAGKNRMGGFCYLNNVAIAAEALLEGKKKIAIFDFDFHYGNGTSELFYSDPNVLYISIHADPALNYPYSGFFDEIGSEEGKGFNVCVPLYNGSGNNEVVLSLDELILPILSEFKPNILAVSAGFDGYENDPVGDGFLQFSDETFVRIGKFLYDFGKERRIPIFHILEGGYDIERLPKLILDYISPWTRESGESEIQPKTWAQSPDDSANQRFRHTVSAIKKLQSSYWGL